MFYNDLANFSKVGHVHDWSSITSRPSVYPPESHNHNDLYYTETEITNLLAGFSKSTHSHSWGQITGKPSTFVPSSHNHNDLYYTKTECTTLFSPITVFTTTDPGEGITSSLSDGTLICVYEEV